MSRESLGELEHQVMLALLRVGSAASTVAVVLELESRTGREAAAAAVYIALRRLEEKGLVASWTESPADGEGGRDRRYFRVTEPGLARLRDTREALDSLWEGLDPALGVDR